MFLKRLIINSKQGLIRDILFRKGVNFIVDERNEQERKKTGNNVGKTTVLRLIDYCFGSKGKSIYKDSEFATHPNTTIESFLTEQEVLITIELVEDLEDANSEKVTIARNFLKTGRKILKINGNSIQANHFDLKLKKAIFKTSVDKPTFRQIISKSIRVETDRMDKIVKVLNPYTKNEDYEALYLFWLGINTDKAKQKKDLAEKKRREESFRRRMRKEDELPSIEQKLDFYNHKIKELEKNKDNFNLNENYDKDIENLNQVKYRLNNLSSEISQLKVRKELIIESKNDLEQEYTHIDTRQIKSLYEKAKALIPNIQTSFEDTLKFHNDLITEKLDYITKELPDLEQKIKSLNIDLIGLRNLEVDLTKKIQKSGIAEDLQKLIAELNENYERKGSLEKLKSLWESSNQKIDEIENELQIINRDIASNDDLIESRVKQFNKHFTKMSQTLYGENYILTPKQKKDGSYYLDVTEIEGNPGTGKKKGQIAAFDFAYIQFADDLDIRCLHFIMHDQLENIYDNQLNTLIDIANNEINGQYIVSILRDKIPENIDVSEFEVLSLSQNDKLFKVP